MSYIGQAYMALQRARTAGGCNSGTPEMADTTSIKHPTPLTSGDFTDAESRLRCLATGSRSREVLAIQRDVARHRRCGRPSRRPHGTDEGYDADGFVFYSHISTEGRRLAANPKAALLFWKSLRRRVRIRGNVSPVTEAEADAYFATRPKQAQIGAWASKQSQPLESRFASSRRSPRSPPSIIGEVPRPRGGRLAIVPASNSGTTGVSPARPHRIAARLRPSWSKTRLYP